MKDITPLPVFKIFFEHFEVVCPIVNLIEIIFIHPRVAGMLIAKFNFSGNISATISH